MEFYQPAEDASVFPPQEGDGYSKEVGRDIMRFAAKVLVISVAMTGAITAGVELSGAANLVNSIGQHAAPHHPPAHDR